MKIASKIENYLTELHILEAKSLTFLTKRTEMHGIERFLQDFYKKVALLRLNSGFDSLWAGQKFDKFRLVEFFIHCESNGISSRFSVYLITEGVYHQPQAVSSFAMMIYNGKPLMIYDALHR